MHYYTYYTSQEYGNTYMGRNKDTREALSWIAPYNGHKIKCNGKWYDASNASELPRNK